MKKIMLIFAFFIFGCENQNVPEKILDTVVMVNQSSGIVIYSNEEFSLVLTAYHIIKTMKNLLPANSKIEEYVFVKFAKTYGIDNGKSDILEVNFPAEEIQYDVNKD